MRSPLLLTLNALIVISVIAGAAVFGIVGLTALQTVSSLTVGSPTVSLSGGSTQVSIPISLTNGGYLPLSGVMITANVTDSSGNLIIQGAAGPVNVAPGEKSDLSITAALDPSKLSAAEVRSLLTSSQALAVKVHAESSLPPFVSLTADAVSSLAWGAPVGNLAVGIPTLKLNNATSVGLAVPVSFSNNNSLLSLAGSVAVTVKNLTGAVVGSGSLQVSAPPHSAYSATAKVSISVPQSQASHLFFNNGTLSYNVEFTLNLSGFSYSQTQPLKFQWGAPVGNLTVGTFTHSPVNSTAASFSVPISFTDYSSFVSLSGKISGVLRDQSGNQVGVVDPSSVSVSPGSSFSGVLAGQVSATAASGSSFLLDLTFTSASGTFSVEVTVTA